MSLWRPAIHDHRGRPCTQFVMHRPSLAILDRRDLPEPALSAVRARLLKVGFATLGVPAWMDWVFVCALPGLLPFSAWGWPWLLLPLLFGQVVAVASCHVMLRVRRFD